MKTTLALAALACLTFAGCAGFEMPTGSARIGGFVISSTPAESPAESPAPTTCGKAAPGRPQNKCGVPRDVIEATRNL